MTPLRPTRCPTSRPDHVPQRTCVGCRAVRPPAELVRVAAGPHGVGAGRHLAGRGAWLCGPACLEQALRRKALARALRTTITEPELIQLRESFERTAARMTESSADESIVAPTPTKG